MKKKQTNIVRSGVKWLPGALALTASTHAATVQITLVGNKISSTSAGGNTLNMDVTGDTVQDLSGFAAGFGTNWVSFYKNNVGYAGAHSHGAAAGHAWVGGSFWGVVGGGNVSGAFPVPGVVGLFPVSFADSRINSGGTTSAWLEVQAMSSSQASHTVALTRLIFDDANTTRPAFGSIPGAQTEWGVSAVPEPGLAGVCLLACGAGGLLERRRRKAA